MAKTPKKTKKTIDPNTFAKAFFTDIQKHLALDPDKASGRGAEFLFLPYGILLIHYAGNSNKAYMKAAKDVAEQYSGGLDKMDDAAKRKVLAKLYAEHIVVGLLTPDRQAVPYDAEAKALCAEALSAPGMEPILDQLINEAGNYATFRRTAQAANAKN